MLIKNMKYRILSYIQTDAYDHDFDSEESLGQYDDGVTRSVVTGVNFEETITVPSLANIIDGSTGQSLQQVVDAVSDYAEQGDWVHTFIGDSAIDLKRSQLMTRS